MTTIAKIDSGPIATFCARAIDINSRQAWIWWFIGPGAFLNIFFTIFASADATDAGSHIPHDTLTHIAIGLWITLFGTALFVFLYGKYRSLYAYPYYGRMSNLFKATKAYHCLNEENKTVARPVVQWIATHENITDSTGKCMWTNECEKRVAAIDRLLKEQAATENVLATIANDDIAALEQYTHALADARNVYKGLINQ